MKKPGFVFSGVNIGDYEFNHETVLDVIKKYKFGRENGDLFHFCVLRMDKGDHSDGRIYEWARYLRENGVYFIIKNNYPRTGKISAVLSKEQTARVIEEGGEYFLGEVIGEFGGFYATRAKGYLTKEPSVNPIQGMKDCLDAKETYKRQIGERIKMIREHGDHGVLSCQAVTLLPYDYEAGIDAPVIELAPRNMEQIMSFGRGANRAFKKDFVGAWLAHEFYGGYHQFDPLKAKRFKMEYLSMYLGGIDYVGLESGYREIHSHVDEILPADHPLTKSYLKEAEDFAKFCKNDVRPDSDGPITKVAFVQGNLDGFGWGNSSSLWGQYYEEKWGFAAPEFSYRILDEVYHSCEWHNAVNYGDYDYSHAPGYGVYDVIPATMPLEIMKRYEWVIFCGWNSMTPEIVEKLKAYVRGGGNLLITAAHIRDSIDREKKGNFVPGIEELLGVKLSGETFRCNDGFKFSKYSTVDGVMYPGTKHFNCDPAWSAGYTNYVKMELTTATPACYISDSFFARPDSQIPVVVENKYGLGNVIFMANSEYPGAPEVFPLYKIMTKAVLAASHRTSDLKVIGSDKLRFAMYEGEEKYKLYVVNSDFNTKQFAKVIFRGEEREIVIDSVGLEILEFKK